MPVITFDAVAARLKTRVPREELTPQTYLSDIAPDSLELVEMMIYLQEEFGVHFTQSDLRPVLTLGDLVALMRGQTHAASS